MSRLNKASVRRFLLIVPFIVVFLTSGIAADKYWERDGSVAGSGAWDTGSIPLWNTASAGAALTTWNDNDNVLFRAGATNIPIRIVGTIHANSISRALSESHTFWSESYSLPPEPDRLIYLRMWQVFGCETTMHRAEFSIKRRWTFSDSQAKPVKPALPGEKQGNQHFALVDPGTMAFITFGGILILFTIVGILMLFTRSRSSSLRQEVSHPSGDFHVLPGNHSGSRASALSQISKKSVLIVDDDEGMTSMLTTFLGRYNYAASRLLDSTKVVEWLKANTCDAVILDLVMPNLDGVSLLRMIRAQFALPVVVFTGSGYENDKVMEVMRAGATAYLTKGDGLEELSSTLRKVPSLQPELTSGSANRMRPRKRCLPA